MCENSYSFTEYTYIYTHTHTHICTSQHAVCRVKFLMLWNRTIRLILSIKEGKILIL
jgi:hypothetical protein